MSKPFVHLHLTRALAVVDLETTGVSLKNDRIIEIAVVKFAPEGNRIRFYHRINPGIPIPASATAVHGIADKDVADCPQFATIAAALARFLRDCDLAGYGICKFDLPMLVNEFTRAGIHFSLNRRGVLDALKIFHRREPRDLAAAVRHYLDREHDEAHSALADVYAAAA